MVLRNTDGSSADAGKNDTRVALNKLGYEYGRLVGDIVSRNPELVRVITAWPGLAEETRAQILALCQQ
ncbi:MAG: hypothetical protein A2Y76_11360 [Planctomycetes bacterium RBG_13_60_9]|nr:MAG: hypothetical protein A2Y76_11360 [Planctomycetes bacterium RBG_13_60_9]